MAGILVPVGGAFLLLMLVFQVLVGKRVIKFKGKLHSQVHKWTAYTMIAFAVFHGLYGTHTFLGWPF